MTAVSVGPIVTNSVTKLDRRLEGRCIGNFQRIVPRGTNSRFITAVAVQPRM